MFYSLGREGVWVFVKKFSTCNSTEKNAYFKIKLYIENNKNRDMEMLNEILKWERKRWKGVIYAHMLQSYKQFWGNFAYHSVLTCMSIFLYIFFVVVCSRCNSIVFEVTKKKKIRFMMFYVWLLM